MKKYILIMLLISLSLNSLNSQWRGLDTNEYSHNRTVNYEDNIKDISCIDSLNCIASQDDGGYLEIVHTSDGGLSWFSVHDEIKKGLPITVGGAAWTSEKKYYIFLKQGYIRRSTDRGLTFKDTLFIPSIMSYINRFEMENDNSGIAYMYNEIFYTKDGWDSYGLIEGGLPGVWGSATIINGKIRVVKDGYDIEDLDNPKARFMETTDYGKTWYGGDTLDIQSLQIYFYNDDIGWIVGGKLTGVGDRRMDIIYKTTDAGRSWVEQMRQKNNAERGLGTISFIDENYGVTAGPYGRLYQTSDGGNTWIREYIDGDDSVRSNGTLTIGWAGRTPLLGTTNAGMNRYFGNFFDLGTDVSEEVIDNKKIKMQYNNSFLQISIEDKSFKKYEFIISDILGNKVMTGELDSGGGVVYQAIDIRTLISGSYYLLLSKNGNYVSSGKFYKME